MMKKIHVLMLGAFVALGLSSCIKEGEPYDREAQYALEKPVIEEYVLANMPGAMEHEETGVWYEIVEPGEPGSFNYKTTYPNVYVNYVGELLDGTEFDSDDSESGAKLPLGNMIGAWQLVFFPTEIRYDENGELLPETFKFGGLLPDGLQKGAKIRFVTPSFFAYAQQGRGTIKPNSPLYFEIEVVDIEDPN
ncbi:FKBP-type peptidyl-prolyl cis-trans isomerase [Parapedobacter sp. 10938]|uniref:FKBP-type peptidyl-prolyl cis-trans isomerase n=1 Tax=Parapedobacter flavus TaxID=3110225 RepID=UPI002DBB890F|nr:FKBP-type peptidyl-prolyl cis-trans isomerase [Parapedobacter sp. 10938]MEC3880497.1 FKBP-type peptidyl-prolyl cis-trans isomerase [Parapedobacter sp. 10938]